MTNDQASKEINNLKLAVGAYTSIFTLKLIGYFLTGVIVLLAEALHSMTDILISIFLLISVRWSQKGADEDHMYGHGRAQNVAALAAATLFLSFTSYKLYEEAIPRLFSPGEANYQNLELAIGVLIVSMLINAAPLVRLVLQKSKGSAAKAQLFDLANDELGLLAALIGTGFVLKGIPIADPIAAIIVATIIAINAIKLFRENLSLLLGRSPGPEFLENVKNLALSVPGVISIHELRVEFIGPETIHSGFHIVVKRGLLIEEADSIADEVRRKIHNVIDCRYCVIHVDPEDPEHLQND